MTNNTQKVAVVTGAGGTLCSEMSRNLASQGIKVALLGRDIVKLEKVAQEITAAGGIALSFSTDVTSLEEVTATAGLVAEKLGVVSILINGAGGNQPAAITTTTEFTEEELEESQSGMRGFFQVDMARFMDVIETNTMGTVIPSQVFGKVMAKNGGGSIINIASMNSYRPLTKVAAYGMAKAGIANFTQWLAAYLAPANIRVNAIAPGFFLNDRSRKLLLNEDGSKSPRGASIISHTPQRRFGEAPELVGCMNWLLQDESAGFVTGIVVPVDGGFLASAGV